MMTEYDYLTTQLTQERTNAFKESVVFKKGHSLPKESPLTTRFLHQLKTCIPLR